ANNSNVTIVRGTAYNCPSLMTRQRSRQRRRFTTDQRCTRNIVRAIDRRRAAAQSVDVALMGNILQHLRDPFLAIERVAQVVRKRIIISESIWTGDKGFLDQAQLQLIPRSNTPLVNHSWYQVSPVFV